MTRKPTPVSDRPNLVLGQRVEFTHIAKPHYVQGGTAIRYNENLARYEMQVEFEGKLQWRKAYQEMDCYGIMPMGCSALRWKPELEEREMLCEVIGGRPRIFLTARTDDKEES